MTKNVLIFNDGSDLDTVAHSAYRMLAHCYKWNLLLASNFEPRRLLYAKNATEEGYSVWILAHSNLISEEDPNGLWKNKFKKDMLLEQRFPEAVIKYEEELYCDQTKRVVFAKKASGKYYFMGIYEPVDLEEIEDDYYVKTYKRVSTQNPDEKMAEP